MALGLFGTVLPFFPGLPLIWGAALFYGFNVGWDTSGVVAMSFITVFVIAGIGAKIALPARSVAEAGAPSSTLMAGAVLGLIGFFAIPLLGLPLGAVSGVMLAEYRRTGSWSRAWQSTKRAIIGFGIGTLIEIGAGLAMIASWTVWLL